MNECFQGASACRYCRRYQGFCPWGLTFVQLQSLVTCALLLLGSCLVSLEAQISAKFSQDGEVLVTGASAPQGGILWESRVQAA